MARLARLSLEDDEIEALRADLSAVLEHVATVRSVDVEGVGPFTRPGTLTGSLATDESRPGMTVERLLALAPAAEGDYIAVPKVLETGGS